MIRKGLRLLEKIMLNQENLERDDDPNPIPSRARLETTGPADWNDGACEVEIQAEARPGQVSLTSET
jgi:hypothetical protein